jgi:hypothetical protein
VNAEIAKDGIVRMTLGTWFSIFTIKSRIRDSGILVNSFGVVNICVSISINTLIGTSRKIPEDEFSIVNIFRI